MSDALNCETIAPYLSPFADGELGEPMRSDVAAHVGGCEYCSAQLDRIHAVDQMIARLPQTRPSAGVFERTLAAATRNASVDPRAVTREKLPGADVRQRLREIIASDMQSDGGDITQRHTPTRWAGRAPWVAAAIPLVAALLLISLAVTLFNRFPSMPQAGANSHPPSNAASPLQQTHTEALAVANQLVFTPIIPSYLPDGASAPIVRVGPDQVDASSRYLDITWTYSSGPVQSLHLRELPAGLGFDGYTIATTDVATLTWSLPGNAGWHALTPTNCPTCLAVGESRANGSLAQDQYHIGQWALDAQPRGTASPSVVAAWLRLVSLSLDAPYKPLGVSLAAPDSSLALRYQATVSDGQGRQWSWTATIAGADGSRQYARVIGNGSDITEIVNGAAGSRLDNADHVYDALVPPLPTAQPPRNVTQPLFIADEFLSSGELWNLGQQMVTLPDGRKLNAYELYRVNAAQPERLYADAATGQVIALVVTAPSTIHPGSVAGSQTYVSATACQPYTVTYTSIEYTPESALSSTLFTVKPPAGWSRGTVAPAFTCQG